MVANLTFSNRCTLFSTLRGTSLPLLVEAIAPSPALSGLNPSSPPAPSVSVMKLRWGGGVGSSRSRVGGLQLQRDGQPT